MRVLWQRVVVLALVICSCAAGVVTIAPLEDALAELAQPPCTTTVTPDGANGSIRQVVERSGPGETVCVDPGTYAERVVIDRSGAAGQPLTVRATTPHTASTQGFIVTADHVVVQGFSVSNPVVEGDEGRGFGIYLAGLGLAAVGNALSSTAQDGIGCEQKLPHCPGAIIRGNVVVGAEGAGIVTYGDDVLIESNDVSRSTAYRSVDADGIRFYGARVRLLGNYVHDISAAGYPAGEAPHTDCFQTFPKSGFAVADIVVEGNRCVNVDDQCLIADGPPAPSSGPPITFANNDCSNNGSQALLIRRLPGMVISGNNFGPTIYYWGVNLLLGSTDAQIVDNTFTGTFHPVKVDASSREGLVFQGPIFIGD